MRGGRLVAVCVCLTACNGLWGLTELDYVGGGGAAPTAITSVSASSAPASSSSTGQGGGGASGMQAGGAGGAGGNAPAMVAGTTCEAILMSDPASSDGVYTLDPDGDGGDPPFDAYCDMTTDAGGWTLVWAYRFTNYDAFNDGDNAIEPRPSWPSTGTPSTAGSTTPPLSPTDYNAVDFARWASIGDTVLVTSNINHWLRCTPDGGSLVTMTAGDIDCTIVQPVATACTQLVPDTLLPATDTRCSPALNLGARHYYCWDSRLDIRWPTHDPCGNNDPNQLENVANARGAIYLR